MLNPVLLLPAHRSPPLLTAHLCKMKPRPCTHTLASLPWEEGTGAAQEELGAACPCSDLSGGGDGPLQGLLCGTGHCPSAGTKLRFPHLWGGFHQSAQGCASTQESLCQLFTCTGLFQGREEVGLKE